MSRLAVGVLLLAAAGGVAFMLWPRKGAAPAVQQPGGKPGKSAPAWTPGAVLNDVVSTLSGNKSAGERAGSVVASNAAKAQAAIEKARSDAGATFAGWIASLGVK